MQSGKISQGDVETTQQEGEYVLEGRGPSGLSNLLGSATVWTLRTRQGWPRFHSVSSAKTGGARLLTPAPACPYVLFYQRQLQAVRCCVL